MACLSLVEKELICRLFDIKDGYVFYYLKNKGYNKTKTKELILSSCGINIYEDKEFEKLSQQRCVEKIWNEKSPQMVAQLIQAMFDYFIYDTGITIVPKELERDFTMIRETIERLKKTESVELPEVFDVGSLKTILEDIETNLKNSKPEMALDRLHTYTTEYFRSLCQKHELSIEDAKGINYPLHSLVGNLNKWYKNNDYFESEFSPLAIQNSISIFDKFNMVRNNQSAAHPNEILNRVEAEYVVHMVADTLKFIEKLEKIQG